jgi:hypothetical protein
VDVSENFFWLSFWTIVTTGLVAVVAFVANAVAATPDPSVECFKAGGTWAVDRGTFNTQMYCARKP